MKVNDLRSILNTDVVLILVDNTVQRFCNSNTNENNYIFWKGESTSLWDIYGECEITQMYADDNDFNIELV